MKNIRYQAIEVIQQPGAAPMYLITAPADELLEWCDVPRTKEDYMAGYQRVLSEPRAMDISGYLSESQKNILPGAIIVATDDEYVKVVNENGSVFLEVQEDTRDLNNKVQELFGSFSTRLSEDELRSADIVVMGRDEEDSEETYPSSYLAVLAKELQLLIIDSDELTDERKKAILGYIEGASKPGLIIDGQHRVIGAKNVSKNKVMLPIVVLHGIPHEEQVFQFYVLNSKAKPLKPTELRRIVSTSLTNEEIDVLFQRFRKTGLDPEEARWTYEMSASEKSVFKGLIDFGFGNEGEVIKENVADQLVRSFMKMPRSKYSALIDPVKSIWEDPENRLTIFFNFWKAISVTYEDAWDEALKQTRDGKQHQMFYKVALLTLQTFLLDRFCTALPYRDKKAPPPFADETSTKDMIENTLSNLPSKFFTQEWKMKQIDTSEGRKLLYEEMEKAWSNQGRNLGNMRLFKG